MLKYIIISLKLGGNPNFIFPTHVRWAESRNSKKKINPNYPDIAQRLTNPQSVVLFPNTFIPHSPSTGPWEAPSQVLLYYVGITITRQVLW
jgi:hypothetical protein